MVLEAVEVVAEEVMALAIGVLVVIVALHLKGR